MKLYSPAVLTALMKKHNFRASKSLGQNFLIDKNIIDKITEAAKIGSGDMVIEIGPGAGVLTAAAADLAGTVIAVEKDAALLPVLSEALSRYNNVEIINGDILKTDINDLISRYGDGREVKIIGNLPYYITTPIIMKIAEEKTKAKSLTVMMQKEVADRIEAEPGTKAYGALTVAVNYYFAVSRISDVPKSVFVPKPKVDSTILLFTVREKPPVSPADEKVFFACIKAGFGQRRKTLLNSLTGLYGLGRQEITNALNAASIDPKGRAETLSIFEFSTLANCIYEERNENN